MGNEDDGFESAWTYVECSICRKIHTVPENGVEGFPLNRTLQPLLELNPGKNEKISSNLKNSKKIREITQMPLSAR